MCWSANSSKNAYIIGTLGSLILLYFGNNIEKTIGLFSLTIVQMQLIEYIIWIDKDCGKMNNVASKLIITELIFQILSLVLGCYLFNSTLLSKKQMKTILIVYIIIIFALLGFYYFKIYDKQLCTKKLENKGLEWDMGIVKYFNKNYFNTILNIFYFGSLFFLPLIWKNKIKKYFFILFWVFSLLYIKKLNSVTWQSRWCFPSAFLPYIFIILMILKIN
tara:strand:+ start:13356 stop:14012 length:657 start_codon:yes stop_codon:yes gene_type:complete